MNKQQLQTELMLLCDYALLSKEGKVSAIGIFEELLNSAPPIVLGRAFLVATVSGTPNTSHAMVVKIEHGNKRENLLPLVEVNIQTGPNGKSNLLVELQGITFPQPGNYSVRLYADGEEVGSKELVVKRVKKEEKTPN